MLAFNPFSHTSQNLQFGKKNIRDSNQENLRCCALILNLLPPLGSCPLSGSLQLFVRGCSKYNSGDNIGHLPIGIMAGEKASQVATTNFA